MTNLTDKKLLTIKQVIAVIGFLGGCAGTWYGNKITTQAQFAAFKEELHVFIAEEKAANHTASKDIEKIKVDQQSDRNKINEVEKDVFYLMATLPKQTKIEKE